MYKIVSVSHFVGGIQKATSYIHSKWGSPSNYPFYLDAIQHSSSDEKSIPQFYLLLSGQEIVGCYGLIINDFISRHDLYPWLCSLFIESEHRGNRLSETIFVHARQRGKAMGYKQLYLTTDHDGLYEKFGWQRIEDGYDIHGSPSRIYRIGV